MTKKLKWEWVEWPGNPAMGNAWRAKVGRGALWLLPFDTRHGVNYCSDFGPDSEKSFGGFMGGVTVEEAKEQVLEVAKRYW